MQMMACIGEQFTEGDEICGVVVNVRARQDRLCMWTKTASNEAAQVCQMYLTVTKQEHPMHVPAFCIYRLQIVKHFQCLLDHVFIVHMTYLHDMGLAKAVSL